MKKKDYKLSRVCSPKYLMQYIVCFQEHSINKCNKPIRTTDIFWKKILKKEPKLPHISRRSKSESKLHFHGKHVSNTIKMKFSLYYFDKFQTTILKRSVDINILMVSLMLSSILNHLQYLQGTILNRAAWGKRSPHFLFPGGGMHVPLFSNATLIYDMRWLKVPLSCRFIKHWHQDLLGGFTRLYIRWPLLFGPQT